LFLTVFTLWNFTMPAFFASSVVCSVRWDAVPPMWNVRMVSCVPGSPIDWAAMTPTAMPISTRIAPLRDDALPALVVRALPRLRVLERRHAFQGRPQGQPARQGSACVEWQWRQVAAVEPQDVEHVVGGLALPAPHPGRLASRITSRTGRSAIARATEG
jgi:hypothetical protein